MTPLDPAMVRGYHGSAQGSYRIPARLTSDGALVLSLSVAYSNILAARLRPAASQRHGGG
jgi:hypothetical protein